LTIGVVSEIARTEKGAPYIVVNGTRLYASKCETPPTGLTVGMKIDFEANPFGDTGSNGKRPMGLKRWKAVVDAQGKPETGSTVTDGDILRSVSNIVGSACAGGKVADPTELVSWINAAYYGFTNMGKTQAPVSGVNASGPASKDPEHDFDDSAAFAGSANPDNMPPW
jgi:hypothetical protein